MALDIVQSILRVPDFAIVKRFSWWAVLIVSVLRLIETSEMKGF